LLRTVKAIPSRSAAENAAAFRRVWEEERNTALLVTHDIDEAIYLADRTVVMTAHPGRVREIIAVDREEAIRGAVEIAASPCHSPPGGQELMVPDGCCRKNDLIGTTIQPSGPALQ